MLGSNGSSNRSWSTRCLIVMKSGRLKRVRFLASDKIKKVNSRQEMKYWRHKGSFSKIKSLRHTKSLINMKFQRNKVTS